MRKVLLRLVCCAILALGCQSLLQAAPEGSDRRAKWHAKFKSAQPVGREIVSIEPQSVLNAAGLVAGDILLAVDTTLMDNELIVSGEQWWDIIYGLRADKPTTLTYKRNGQITAVDVTFNPVEKEQYEQLNTEYGFITSDFNIRQRYIITHPEMTEKQPAIFVVGGLSCSSLESTPGRKSNFIRSLRDLVQQSGMLVMRVEKPGVGDSEGPMHTRRKWVGSIGIRGLKFRTGNGRRNERRRERKIWAGKQWRLNERKKC